jgi:alkylation response protein AidB-like acyl-CoA dehydrogenase
MTDPSRPAISSDSRADDVVAEIERWVSVNVPRSWQEAAVHGSEALREVRTREDYVAWYPVLGRAGLVAPTWPVDFGGLGVNRETATLIEAELRYLSLRLLNPLGLNNTASALFAFGTEEQKRRFLPRIVTNEEKWCQLFSEPGAGSDLASLATRAVRDGDEWIISGQKVWTTWADDADLAILLARTDPAKPKNQGITYFLLDMHQPGVEIRPLYQMTGGSEFNEVFLDDARVPDFHRLGEVNGGWRVAGATLSSERQMVSGGGPGESAAGRLVDSARSAGRAANSLDRQTIAAIWAEEQIRRWTNARVTSSLAAGQAPGPAASIGKVHQAGLNQRLQEASAGMLGPAATAWLGRADHDPEVATPISYAGDLPAEVRNFLRSRANTIEGGTSEINRNILGERVLGLPREPDRWRGEPWQEVPRS